MTTLHDTTVRGFASDNYSGVHPEILEAIAAANAIAETILAEELHPDYIIPSVFDRRVGEAVAALQADACLVEGLGESFVDYWCQIKEAEIARFKQDPQCRLFLSTDSGSVGLNLQAASAVINLDLPWNPAKLEQRTVKIAAEPKAGQFHKSYWLARLFSALM